MKSASAQSRPYEYAKGGDMKMGGSPARPTPSPPRCAAWRTWASTACTCVFMGPIDGETAHICETSAELFAGVMSRFEETPACAAACLVAWSLRLRRTEFGIVAE